MSKQTSFSVIADSTPEDWDIIMRSQYEHSRGLVDRVIDHMKILSGGHGGYPVNRLEHCLQTAELAAEDGRDDEYVACALLHDIGDTLGIYNHSDVAAAILKPFVSEANHWMVKNHAVFQGYNFFHMIGLDRNMRDKFKDSPYYDKTEEFVMKYDNPAFDANRKAPDLDHFRPILEKVMDRPVNGLFPEVISAHEKKWAEEKQT